ncbi:MAG: AAA family ATPase [Chitinivibrionales bacterium]|nr:AAA family ATPase [Chitinivibrionales bacterium]
MAEKVKDKLRFSRITLENWKNFAHVDAALERRVFLVGPNASGKSNFLDVFRFLRDLSSPGGGFREAISRRGGVTAIRCLAAKRYPEVTVRALVEAVEGKPRWEYELRFNQDKQSRARVCRERVVRDGQVLLDRPDKDDARDAERLTQTHLEQVNVNREFRDLVGYFESVRYLHIVPQLVREPDRSVGRSNDPFGGDFLEQLAKTQERTRRARLRRITEALHVAVPQLMEIDMHRDERGAPHVRGRYDHWRHQGAWQSEEQFSDGTLRLMGLLWALMEGTGPVLLEEPELSLHPEIVRFLPQMFARVQRRTGKQVILSTHSADLLRDEGIGLDEVLLLRPGREGTTIAAASEFGEIRHLLEGGVTLDEAVMPKTRPEGAEQLSLFEDL